MRVVRVLHWRAVEADPLLSLLRRAGFAVEYAEQFSSRLFRSWRENPPSAFVIDLSRLPSQGREIAVALRQSPKTRHVPIVFCEGQPEKVGPIQNMFPDAVFCTQAEVATAVRRSERVENPQRPTPMMERSGGKTAAQKLGIVEGSSVALIDPPRDVATVIGKMPANVQFTEEKGAVTLCFVHDVDSTREKLSEMRKLAAKTRLWILWRKKGASGYADVSGDLIRQTAIDLGLVDYKICAVNETWSAMAFAQRKDGR